MPWTEEPGGLQSMVSQSDMTEQLRTYTAFFMVQLSYPYMTTGKTIGLTIQTFVIKVMSLLFNTLSTFVIAIKRSKCLFS